ncbi:MAG: hypothetical protein WC620_10410 [Methanoregula sp.]|jgi:hypothetical protein
MIVPENQNLSKNAGFFCRLKKQLHDSFLDFFIYPLKSAYHSNPLQFVGLCMTLIPLLLLPIIFIPFIIWMLLFRGNTIPNPNSGIFFVFFAILGVLTVSMAIGTMFSRPNRLEKIRDSLFKKSGISLQQKAHPTEISLIPTEIKESYERFKYDYPDPSKVGFIMMQFGKTEAHGDVLGAVRLALKVFGCAGIRADDKEYHDDKYYNILTYLHGCGFGIAIFDMIEEKSFNPNVSLELGYLFGLGKSSCLLKEKSLTTLPSDLGGTLYREFDAQTSGMENADIYYELCEWLENKGYRCVDITSKN